MNYAKVKIDAPGGEHTFQSGRTDRNGRFCFFPDVQGEWKMIVDDEMGHRLEVKVPVDDALRLEDNGQPKSASSVQASKYERAFMGISILLGLSGIVFWWKGRRKKVPNS
jgi:nickel transport protein